MKTPIKDQTKVDFSRFENGWYTHGASLLKRSLWYFINTVLFINPFNPISSLKVWLLRIFGAKVGQNVVIKPGVNIKHPWYLTVGDYVWIGENVWIDNLATVVIGNNVSLSQGAMLLTGSHNYKKAKFDLIVKSIYIEDGVWIGAKSVVCPGVTCFSHSILTVGSVATKDLEAYFIYQGVPAEKKRERIIDNWD